MRSFISGKDGATVRACFATWKIVGKVDDEGNRNDFYPFPSSPPVPRPFPHVSQDVDGNQQLPSVDGTDLSPSELCVFLEKISFVSVSTREPSNEENHGRSY